MLSSKMNRKVIPPVPLVTTAYTVPTGFVAKALTWGPHGTSVVQSNSNKTCNMNSDWWYRIIAGSNETFDTNAGKVYFEIKCDYQSRAYASIGLMAANADYVDGRNPPAANYNYAGAWGGTSLNGVDSTGGPVYGTGDTISIAVDCATQNIWMAKNGVWMTGNPSTNTSPLGTLALVTFPFRIRCTTGSSMIYLQYTTI